MLRTKVVNDSTDLVPLLRAFDNKTKKQVFNELLGDWKPLSEIKEKYGDDGEVALEYFDKMKLVETKWTTPDAHHLLACRRTHRGAIAIVRARPGRSRVDCGAGRSPGCARRLMASR